MAVPLERRYVPTRLRSITGGARNYQTTRRNLSVRATRLHGVIYPGTVILLLAQKLETAVEKAYLQ